MSINITVDFAYWLASKWHSNFTHSYWITNSVHWKFYRDKFNPELWSCTTLKDSLSKYSWAGGGYTENSIRLSDLSKRLQKTIEVGSNSEAMWACEDVLRWGGVYRPNQSTAKWVKRLNSSGELCSTLTIGIDALRTGKSHLFDGTHLLMNSGTTKIFSLANPCGDLIIYDGRVGAALGLFAREFCIEKNISVLPAELKFFWGSSRDNMHNRNPSTDQYRFPQLFSGVCKNENHAEMVIKASNLLRTISNESRSLRDWEAALFMIGYELSFK